MKNIRVLIILLVTCLVSIPCPSYANPSVMVSGSGLGDFSIMAMQMEDIVAMDIDISYDMSTLFNPKVSPTGLIYQAEAKVVSNTSVSGSINISVSSKKPIEGYGNIFMLDFEPLSETSPGLIKAVRVSMTKSNGQNISVPVVIENPPSIEKLLSDREKEASVNTSTATSPQPSTGGDESGATQSDQPGNEEGRTASVGNPSIRRKRSGIEQFLQCRSPLNRMKDVAERKSRKDLSVFFMPEPECPVRQEPGAALADGKTVVTLFMRLGSEGEDAPNFALKGLRWVSLEEQGDTWIMKVLPYPGVLDASVSAAYDGRLVEYQLTVAPPLEEYLNRQSATVPDLGGTVDYVRFVNRLVLGPAP